MTKAIEQIVSSLGKTEIERYFSDMARRDNDGQVGEDRRTVSSRVLCEELLDANQPA